MDDILSKEEYLELKKMYDTENEQFEKELDELKNVEGTEMTVMQDTVKWLNHFSRGKITAAQLTREVLVELIDRIYVYPDQQIDIYFNLLPGLAPHPNTRSSVRKTRWYDVSDGGILSSVKGRWGK